MSESTGSHPIPAPVTHPASLRIPDHQLIRKIGGGSYGEVWLARNVLGEFRAVKVVYRDRFEHERPYEREFEGIRKFEPISRLHDSQVDILHVGRNNEAGFFYYVMELADDVNEACRMKNVELTAQTAGENAGSSFVIRNSEFYIPHTLKLDLHRRSRLPVDECVRIGLALTTGVQHLHEHGLVHRDIKPSNIIFVGGVPKLADIGLVASMDQTMSFVGTSGFLPPEGPGTPQADLYSLGKVLYELSTGSDRTDFPKLPPELLSENAESPNDASPSLPHSALRAPHVNRLLELNAVILKACHHDPCQRYQSAKEMATDLALLQRGESVKRKRQAEKRFAIIQRLLVPTMLLAVLVAGGGYWGRSSHDSRERHTAVDPTRRADAQKLYTQAKTYPRNTRDGVNNGIDLLNQAIVEDPVFAAAYAELALIYFEAGSFVLAPKHSRTEARKNALRAIQLDASLPMAHTILACVLWDYDWDLRGAEAEFRQALPAHQKDVREPVPSAYSLFASFLSSLGRFSEADEILKQGELIFPEVQVIPAARCGRYHFERRFPDAIQEATRLLAHHPDDPVGLERLAFAHERLGHFNEALVLAERVNEVAPGPDSLAVLGFIQARMGRGEEARKLLDTMRGMSQARPDWTAQFFVGLGEKEQALEALEEAVEQRFIGPFRIQDPIWDEVRSHKRFQRLLRKMGMEK